MGRGRGRGEAGASAQLGESPSGQMGKIAILKYHFPRCVHVRVRVVLSVAGHGDFRILGKR